MKHAAANSVRGALTLLVFALVFTALMSGTWWLTRDIVARNEQASRVALLAQVLPAFDNDLLADAIVLPAADAARVGGERVYPARRNGRVVAFAIEATAPDGYSGAIRLLVGVDRDGRVRGVRVIAHKETPGLGDYIDAAKSTWSDQFDGKSLDRPAASAWAVKKDGGAFDYMAGATVSPRAVVKAMKRALELVREQQAQWIATKEQQ
ncbi:electron transport complex subunit RsxG [Chitiniphilus eburneus]|uniref:Ion-translocating oxidoreductase complex subunit G n=1 Tax=Chitiniphilus eburneus TaxID=2571148 RepID=A0A4U0P7W5_9NEIS|nr:electron transport complex subunit RsxG [Chitiniphilus eburneus]TJZ63583.1 electron transport complex subunit RsxG [Chitiniphilus eburneus]